MTMQLQQWSKRVWGLFRKSWLVIFFFLTCFACVYALFGIHYIMVVSIVTMFFQTRYKTNKNTFYGYIRLLLVGSILILLAYISTLHFYLCIILNLCVPFILAFTLSSQFKPKGYFSYAMIFVFLSLMPPGNPTELVKEFVTFWFCVQLLVAFIWLYHWFSPCITHKLTLKVILCEISDMITLLIQPDRKKELKESFQNLVHEFHQTSYHQNFFSVKTRENQIYDMIDTLIQRFSYMVTDNEWREELDDESIQLLKRMAAYFKKTAMQLDTPAEAEQIKITQAYLEHVDITEGRIHIFCRSILHMVMLILNTKNAKTTPLQKIRWINWREILQQIKIRLSFESFEMRVAIRLAAVMTVSCAITYILPVTHSYWIPLNAFLLSQPSYEESSYRMKTRPIGTFIGCCIEFLVHPLLPGVGAQIIFALVMISFMYCATPGTWYHPIFSTCYALTLAGMTIDETVAITLRLLFLGMAVAIVFIVNRFFFPIRKETLFYSNLKTLVRLNCRYWSIIKKGLYRGTDLSVSGEILTYFHMIFEECSEYLNKNPNLPYYTEANTLLLTLWHMFSELEQMHYLVRVNRIFPEEREETLQSIAEIQKNLYPKVDYEKIANLKETIQYQDPEVNYIMKQYLTHAELLQQYKQYMPAS